MIIPKPGDGMKTPTVAEALCRELLEEGVDVVFGHPGGAILPFYDALYRAEKPRHILMRHEQGAAHAADGYARATGRVGVCVATSGPGATNLVTGLATSIMDSVPVVAITGQVPTAVRGQDAFQETDIIGITMAVTKHGFMVEDAADLPAVVHEAFKLAVSGRPGPVLIDIPKDLQNSPCPTVLDRASAGNGAASPGAPATATLDPAELERAAELLNRAERPLIMAGRGVVLSGVGDQLREFAERTQIPVVTTLLGLDGFPATHPLAVGMPGMHGTVRSCHAIQRADVILGLGLRFDDRVTGPPKTFAPGAAIIHADIDPVSVGRTVRPTVRLFGDLRTTFPTLTRRVHVSPKPEWWDELTCWPREAEPWGPVAEPSGPLTSRHAVRGMAERIAASGAAVATDVGQHQMLMAQELGDAAPGTHITSGGLGTMGYALPAAFGAAVGRPDRPTWVVAGDGGFQMTFQELATIFQERVPLRIAVVNNGYLGMVRQWQELFYEGRYSASELPGPDFVMLARAFGIPARPVSRADELEPALDWAEASPGPVVLDLRVPRDENVYPMVPPGAALHEVVPAPPAEAIA